MVLFEFTLPDALELHPEVVLATNEIPHTVRNPSPRMITHYFDYCARLKSAEQFCAIRGALMGSI